MRRMMGFVPFLLALGAVLAVAGPFKESRCLCE